MRESVFIKQNASRWETLEAQIKSNNSLSPDELSDLYIGLTDDLSYSRTFYPNSNTTKYLNELAAHAHRAIYKNKKEQGNRIIDFWKYEVPEAIGQSHKQLLYAFLFFAAAVAIGAVSSANDEYFVRLILGDTYVNMTEDNIGKGDPMAVYKSMHNTDMFFAISSNNIYVSFVTWLMGIFFSVGTVYFLFNNGIMLGSFQYFFYQKGLLWASVSAIFLHGALEISALVIAGGAGLVLGNSILFPGTYTRLYSVTTAAKRSLKIIMGLVPVFIVAALIESFVTRYYNKMPPVINATIIVVSFIFVLWYFIVYPIKLKNKPHGKHTVHQAA